MTVDGEARDIAGYSVSVANSPRYGGGMRLVPHADIADGRLDVITIERFPKLGFLRVFPRVFRGGHVGHPAVHFFKGHTVELRADRPFVVWADGEPIARLPATVGVLPRCLRVVAPPLVP